MSPHTHNWR